jgi:hypothetical protein
MAIALENATIGDASNNASATTLDLVTTATVASGGQIFLLVHWHHATATASVSGGGLTWTEEATQRDGVINTSLFRAIAPSGLASSTTITATFSSASTGRIMAACSFTGLDTDAKEDSSGFSTDVDAPWTSPTMDPTTNGNLTITAVTLDTDVAHTVTSPSLEAIDKGAAFDYRMTVVYRLESSAGSYTNAGDYAFGGSIVGATAAYGQSTAAVVGPPPLNQRNKSRRAHKMRRA